MMHEAFAANGTPKSDSVLMGLATSVELSEQAERDAAAMSEL
jgi:hypothetical protein